MKMNLRKIQAKFADNWDNFYESKVGLPYVETVGVGENAITVTKNTKEEMIEFLRSDESLTVYSNYQELLAIANLYNININIFKYEGNKEEWKQVCPAPEMVAETEAKLGKMIPDIALYYLDNTHFDLLVKDDSRVALLGLLAGAVHVDSDLEKVAKVDEADTEWITVTSNRKDKKGKSNESDEKLIEVDDAQYNGDMKRTLMKNLS